MSQPVRFRPEAARELDEAIDWYDERNPGLGGLFESTIDATITAISRWPRRGSPVDGTDEDLDIRRSSTGRFPYQVIYLNTETAVVVLAIAHQHRRSRYWVRRTP